MDNAEYIKNLAKTTASNYSMQPGGKPRSQSNVDPASFDSSVTHRDPEPVTAPDLEK